MAALRRCVAIARVGFARSTTTKDARGTVLSATRTEEVHDLAAEAASPPTLVVRGEARGEDVRVGEVAVPTTVRVVATSQGDVQTWTSPSVPFTGLVRSTGANELADLLYRFGTRDYRSLGHKSIFVAHGWRLLQFIGWQHAETVARALGASRSANTP